MSASSPEMLRARLPKHDATAMVDDGDEESAMLLSKKAGGSSDDEDNRGKSGARMALKRQGNASILDKTWRQLRYRWSLLTGPSRVIVSVLAFLAAQHIVLGSIDILFHTYGFEGPALSDASTFAVVINTYKRPDMLQDAVEHYAAKCGRPGSISQVFVVWAEPTTPPADESFLMKYKGRQRADKHARVHVLKMEKDSLNSRFLPIPQLESDALFMVDDDVRLDCVSLKHGFEAWKHFPDSLVGYYPRLSAKPHGSFPSEEERVYHNWNSVYLRSRFNIILTKASFLHKKFLDVYSDPTQHPTEILDFVDKHMNCEDVAMAMLVANYTRTVGSVSSPSSSSLLAVTRKDENSDEREPSRPIYVEGSLHDRGLFGGISTGGDHFDIRSLCLVELTKMYKQHGWGDPLDFSVSMRDSTYLHHAPGFWFQFKPSNIFEWFAINVFTIFK